jgi:hypothetical protein
MIIEHALTPDYDHAEEFDFGLDLILDGLESTSDQGAKPDRVAPLDASSCGGCAIPAGRRLTVLVPTAGG